MFFRLANYEVFTTKSSFIKRTKQAPKWAELTLSQKNTEIYFMGFTIWISRLT